MIPPKYWSPTKKLMVLGAMAGGKLVEDTATGNPLTFTTDKAKPLKSLLIPFSPQQEGTGDPSPQNIRSILPMNGLKVQQTGKNLFDKTNGTENFVWWEGQLAVGYNDFFASNKIPVVPGAKYTLKKDVTGQNQCELFDINGNFVSQSTNMMGLSVSTFIIPDGVYFIAFNINKTALDTAQLEVGSTPTAYEPYKPITETDIVFQTADENIYNSESYPLSDGYFISASTGKTSASASAQNYSATLGYIPISDYAGKVLVLNKRPTGSETAGVAFYESTSQSGYISGIANNGETENTPMVFRVPDNAVYMRFSCVKGETGVTLKAVIPVYGGSAEIVSGAMTQTILFASAKWKDFEGNTEYANTVRKDLVIPYACLYGSAGNGKTLCNVAKYKYNNDDDPHFYLTDAKRIRCFMPKDMDGETEITFACTLAEPIPLESIEPHQLTAIVGNNTIWSDADGQMTAVYLKKG